MENDNTNKNKSTVLVAIVFLILVLGVAFYVYSTTGDKQKTKKKEVMDVQYESNVDSDADTSNIDTSDAYNPQIDPADFTTNITNPYFSLPVGRIMKYEEETAEGLEEIIIEIEDNTRNIMGVETIVYRDKVYVDDVIVEDTMDYLAQDKEGNVWYFGEKVNNYEDGVLVDNDGSWIAGEDGALPGIWIKANHIVGDSYKQEYFKDEAEDMRDVVAINQTVITKYGTYENCVKMYDWTPLDPDSRENKYYCPSVSALVMNENVMTGEKAVLVVEASN